VEKKVKIKRVENEKRNENTRAKSKRGPKAGRGKTAFLKSRRDPAQENQEKSESDQIKSKGEAELTPAS